jgi:uncharacterized protein YidB (DUF937 family)
MGLLDILNGMQNGPRGAAQPGKGGMSPITMGLLALLAYKAYQKLNAGAPQPAPAPGGQIPPAPSNAGGSEGGLGSLLQGGLAGLGGLLGGGGSLFNGGLNDLLRRLDQNGLGDVGKSWIGTGPNQPISPDELHKAVGPDTVTTLAEQSGLSEQEVLSELSRQLPNAVDHITPAGRIPTEREMSSML